MARARHPRIGLSHGMIDVVGGLAARGSVRVGKEGERRDVAVSGQS